MAYKGTDKDLKCQGFQYEIGKEYETDKEIKLCKCGFHACENPLDVFSYYSPSDSKFFEVEQTDRKVVGNNKTVSSRITIKAEIGIKGIVDYFWIIKREK